MIVFNGHTSGLTQVHYQGHSIKEVHNALGKVWPEDTPTPSYNIGRVRFQQKESGSSYTYANKIFYGEGIVDSELIAPQVYSYEMSGETAYPMKAKMSNYTSLIDMQSIKFPNTTRYIDSDFGYNMQGTSENYRDLQMIILNDGLIELKNNAFNQSDNSSVWRNLFKYLIIPSSVERIGTNALRFISPIATTYNPNTPMKVYFESETPPIMSGGIFAYSAETVTTMNSNYVIYVPVGCINAYKAALPSSHQGIPVYEYSEADLNRVNETINTYAQTQGLMD